MQTIWLTGEKESFEKSIRGSQEVLDKLKKICYNKREELNRTRPKDYDCPNWSLKRAHNDGFVEGLEYLISLLTLDQREE